MADAELCWFGSSRYPPLRLDRRLPDGIHHVRPLAQYSGSDDAFWVSAALQAGTIWVNHYRRGDPAYPFGGYGQSGYGRFSGVDGYREMTRVKSVQILLGSA
jgi:hypothetical protein